MMKPFQSQKVSRTFLLLMMAYTQVILPKNTIDDVPGKPAHAKQLTMGNFALPTSQQPGPLIGFGQNIVEAGDRQFFLYANYLKGQQKKYVEAVPSFVYGISDTASLF